MRAISLWQPWASLWLTPWKLHETRHWATDYRGPLAVHAAQRFEKDFGGAPIEGICDDAFGKGWRKSLPTGAILGIVELVDCRRTEDILLGWGCPPEPVPMEHWGDLQCGNFEPQRFGWKRGEGVKRFETPITWRGQQGFFQVPDDVCGFTPPPPSQLALFA